MTDELPAKEDYENQSFETPEQDETQLQQQNAYQQQQEGMLTQQQQQQHQPTIQDYLVALNQSRMGLAGGDDYVGKHCFINEIIGAEDVLHQISEIRSEAESRIKNALRDKHYRERAEVEELHRQEFEQFTMEWDQRIRNIQEVSQISMEQLRQKHSQDINELRMYLESSISLHFKPSPELLNLRKIQQHLSKQKNYTEAEKVQKVVRELEEKEKERYMMQRDEKIKTQIAHMEHKHQMERDALIKKLDTNMKEQEKIRKITQQQMLQKFLNAKNELNLQQQLEVSKLQNQLKIKNYASTIVGKQEGSLKSVKPPNLI